MIPGEFFLTEEDILINSDSQIVEIEVFNSGDRPIQVGSHFHFYESNHALLFDRSLAFHTRLDLASGTAMRFEPGQHRNVNLVHFSGSLTTPESTSAPEMKR
ncbi:MULTISPECIES: urease subunit beta [Acidithrix]|uniref:Urease subunit beta n=1 Tax=Acidithrix ferrooxidans TaxID=1280514 RepID=A0A0D8HIH4_9ACTN|nr:MULTISPECIES: urease subunit beta [Acidithrix]KJF16851.1 urease subunit beta [Acidithrix ferrooxidans]CAG4932151.1 unnamed protein product [Acidithrix sp. C25]